MCMSVLLPVYIYVLPTQGSQKGAPDYRELQIQMVLSLPKGAGNLLQVLGKSNTCF